MKPKPDEWWDTRLKDARTYSNFVTHLGDAQMPSRVLVRRLAQAKGVSDVLDVGCGPALDQWTDTTIEWAGVDASAFLVEKNAARGVLVEHAPAHALPFGDETFDLVYSRHVWEHLPDFKPALVEACRVASKFVAVTFFRPPKDKHEVRITDGTHYNDYRLVDVLAAFEACWPGCSVEKLTLEKQRNLPDGELVLFVTRY